jgi:hypothetical protein
MANDLSAIYSTVVFPMGLDRFREALAGVRYIRQDISNEVVKHNNTIVLELNTDGFVANDFIDGNDITIQNVKNNSISVNITEHKEVSFSLSDVQLSKVNATGLIPDTMQNAVDTLSRQINLDFYSLYKDVNQFSGTGTNNAYKSEDILRAKARLSEALVNGAPAVALSSKAFYDIANEMKVWTQTGSLSESVLMNATLPAFSGTSVIFEDQLLNTLKHTSGSASAGAVTVEGAFSAGVSTISLKTAGATDTLLKGDLIEIAGNQYVIGADAIATTSVASVTISPALVADLVDEDAVTMVGDHEVNLAYTRDFAAFISRALQEADEAIGAAKPGIIEEVVSDDNGISLRFTGFYDGMKKRWIWTVDVLYVVKMIDARYACRILNS